MGWIVYIAVFLSTFLYLKIGGVNFVASDFLFAFATPVFIFKYRHAKLVQNVKLRLLLFLAIFLFFIGFIISVNYSQTETFLVNFAQYAFGFLIVPFLIIRFCRNETEYLNKVLLSFVLGMVTLGVIGIILYYFFPSLVVDFSTGATRRMGSLMGNPNQFASFISITIIIVLYLKAKKVISRLVSALMLGVLTFSLLLTGSIGGLLILGVSLIVYFFFVKGFKSAFYLFSIVVLAVGAYNSDLIPETLSKRISGNSTTKSLGSYEYRMGLNRKAWATISDRPLLGVGLGNFKRHTDSKHDVHNAILLVWAEGGIASIVGLFILFATLLFYSVRLMGTSKHEAGFLAAMIFGVIMGLLVHTHFYARCWFIPLSFIIIILNIEHKNAKV